MELIERKIGETFEYEGKKIRVEESSGCNGCFFKGQCSSLRKEVIGHCEFDCRTDDKSVIFVEITEEQPQKLNLCEILKDCPKGEKFWSPMLGAVKLHNIIQSEDIIIIEAKNRETWEINSDGTMNIGDIISPEIMLYPSKEQRDWSKVKYEKKEKFNPNTLKPFDKIIARIDKNGLWCCELFSFIEEGTNLVKGCGGYYKYCVPYNDDTKHLIETTEEAPEFYRYWED